MRTQLGKNRIKVSKEAQKKITKEIAEFKKKNV